MRVVGALATAASVLAAAALSARAAALAASTTHRLQLGVNIDLTNPAGRPSPEDVAGLTDGGGWVRVEYKDDAPGGRCVCGVCVRCGIHDGTGASRMRADAGRSAASHSLCPTSL